MAQADVDDGAAERLRSPSATSLSTVIEWPTQSQRSPAAAAPAFSTRRGSAAASAAAASSAVASTTAAVALAALATLTFAARHAATALPGRLNARARAAAAAAQCARPRRPPPARGARRRSAARPRPRRPRARRGRAGRAAPPMALPPAPPRAAAAAAARSEPERRRVCAGRVREHEEAGARHQEPRAAPARWRRRRRRVAASDDIASGDITGFRVAARGSRSCARLLLGARRRDLAPARPADLPGRRRGVDARRPHLERRVRPERVVVGLTLREHERAVWAAAHELAELRDLVARSFAVVAQLRQLVAHLGDGLGQRRNRAAEVRRPPSEDRPAAAAGEAVARAPIAGTSRRRRSTRGCARRRTATPSQRDHLLRNAGELRGCCDARAALRRGCSCAAQRK